MNFKKLVTIVALVFAGSLLFAQTHSTVKLSDDVYDLLDSAETQGLCTTLKNEKPYTQSYIVSKLEEIASNLVGKTSRSSTIELKIVRQYLDRYAKNETSKRELKFVFKNNKDNFPITFGIKPIVLEGMFSGGVYTDSSKNSFGFEEWQTLGFFGDLGPYVSYVWDGGTELMKMPIQQIGNDYLIGCWWDETSGGTKEPSADPNNPDFRRYINVFKNYNTLPFSFYKHWDGSIYNLDDFNAGGLKGWPNNMSFGLTMTGGITASFFNNRLNIGISRHNREWAAMDKNSSLALNGNARPFVGLDVDFKVLDWFSFAGLTGFLEFPNQDYINQNAWYIVDKNGNRVNVEPYVKDSYFFQSMFTMNIMNFDFKYFHGDFGSVVIFPKRFELGYLIPMFEKVVYQNNVGDFDNLGLFGSIRGQMPGLGSIWFSGYVDEINAPDIKRMFEASRCMFAIQAGIKTIFPLLPFGNISFRYTKIEPYCYTHLAVRTPYSSAYTSTSYTNNGSPLGYYLEPNSDEFFFRIDGKPIVNMDVGFQYQLVRHGATWGDFQVPGSSIYSEMQPGGRDSLKKYFLRDGVYEWTNVFAIDAAYDLRGHNLPMKFDLSIGYVYSFFTKSGEANYPRPFQVIEKTDPLYQQYQNNNGVVITFGCKFFAF